MTDFKALVQNRRSHRKFTQEEINGEDLRLILQSLSLPLKYSTNSLL